MISPMHLYDVLAHERDTLTCGPRDTSHLIDRATVVWLIAGFLKRYAAAQHAVLPSSLSLQVGTALHEVEREMHWLALYGGDAQEHDVEVAVKTALVQAEQAAALLRTDVSGVLTAVTAGHGNALFQNAYGEVKP